MEFQGETLTVQELRDDSFHGVDVALFSAGGSISQKIPRADCRCRLAHIVVGYNSSAFRMDRKRAAGRAGN